MRIPRDISGIELAKLLQNFGCITMRQAGSHIRLTTQQNGEHSVTIDEHIRQMRGLGVNCVPLI